MRRYISLLLFLSVGFGQKEYNNNDLIEMDNGLTTVKFSDEPISGKVYGYYGEEKNPKKVYIGNIRNGKKEGKWVDYYHSSEKKNYEGNYKDGKQDGLHTWWYRNGQKKFERTNKDGELVDIIGRWKEDGKEGAEGNN
jgi:antitoxin component YwqK of YwqJK toxin-antitoxin module